MKSFSLFPHVGHTSPSANELRTRFRLLHTLLAVLILTGSGSACASQPGPKYADAETKRVIEKMIEAHGGYERWAMAPTISYDNTFFNPFAQTGKNPWWYAQEVIDQKTRRVIQDWTLNDAQLVYDGKTTWTTGWNLGNPPRFMVYFFYYFLDLPWLTQDDNVVLSHLERTSIPGHDESFYAVTMTFTEDPAEGKVRADSYRLFINPDTWLLQGYEYTIGYGAMLDIFGLPDGELFGPTLRIHDTFVDVDGLIFPSLMHTMAPDGTQTWGYHILTHYSISNAFDESRMTRPPDAITDESSSLRKMK